MLQSLNYYLLYHCGGGDPKNMIQIKEKSFASNNLKFLTTPGGYILLN